MELKPPIYNSIGSWVQKSNRPPVLIVKRCLISLLGQLFAGDLNFIASQQICAWEADMILASWMVALRSSISSNSWLCCST